VSLALGSALFVRPVTDRLHYNSGQVKKTIHMRAITSLTLRLLVIVLATGQMVSAQGRQLGTPILGQPVRVNPIGLPLRDDVSRGAFTPNRGSRAAVLHGIVQNHAGALVPLAGVVQLRSLVTGHVVGKAAVDSMATFVVRGFDAGSYTAELLDAMGSTIAASESFTAETGEVVTIAAIIPADPVFGVAQLLNTSSAATAAVVNSAVSAGVLAVDPGVPVSP
jgi:hypothetical protein